MRSKNNKKGTDKGKNKKANKKKNKYDISDKLIREQELRDIIYGMDENTSFTDKMILYMNSLFNRIVLIILNLLRRLLAFIIPGIILTFLPFIIFLLIVIGACGGSIEEENENYLKIGNREVSVLDLGEFTVTAYCPCEICCGEYSNPDNPTTSSGTRATAGRTVAADISVLPYGTQIIINNHIYTVEDTGGAITGNHIDLYYDTHEEAVAFGKQQLNVYLVLSDGEVSIYTAQNAMFVWPVSGRYYVTSVYGKRWGTFHSGIDLDAPTGTPILAGANGKVKAAGYSDSMGNYVRLEHGEGIETIYMHNSTLAVKTGDKVSAGQVIAYSGSTGDSTGPHCHFGVYIDGQRVNPAPFLGLPEDIKDQTDVTDYIKGIE